MNVNQENGGQMGGLKRNHKCAGCDKPIFKGTTKDYFKVVNDLFYHSKCVEIEPIPTPEPEEHTDEGPIAKPTETVINVGTADSTAAPVNFVGDGWYSQTIVSKKIKPSPDWVYRLDSAGSEHCRFVGKNRTLTKAECNDENHAYCPGCPKNLTCHARPFFSHSSWIAWATGTGRDPDQRERFLASDWADTKKYGELNRKPAPKPIAENQDERKGPPLYKGSPTPTVITDSLGWIEEQKPPATETKPFVPLDLKPKEVKNG
jgi:hypothetical protein